MKDYVRLLLVAVIAAAFVYVVEARGESPAAVEKGIRANLEENFRASNAEDLPRLLRSMSREMPQKQLFVAACKKEWAAANMYHRLIDVKVLKHSDAEHARCDYPYAVALVTQQSVVVSQQNIRAMRESCPDGRCPMDKDDELAHIFGLKPKWETVQLQMLFKHENGKWKLVAGLTAPEPVAEDTESAAEPMTARSVF